MVDLGTLYDEPIEALDKEDIYSSREDLLDEDSLTGAEEGFMKGWEDALEDKEKVLEEE